MNDKDFAKALGYMRSLSKPRKFDQSVELILNFKGIDFKKADNRVDIDVKLPHSTGKLVDIKTLVFAKDKAFARELEGKATKVILDEAITSLKKKDVDEIIKEYAVILAEGSSMITVGKHLGQQLAPKGKMPKPILATIQAFEQASKGASTYTKVTNKKGKFMPVVQLMIGKQKFEDKMILENVLEIYNSVISKLPNKEGNIKSVYLKYSMGKPIKVGENYDSPTPETKSKGVSK